jgi:hypothetical protein
MKRTFFISLLLVSIFLISNEGLATLSSNCQDYACSTTGYHYGEVFFNDTDCVELCYNDFEVDINSPFFSGRLYPVTGSKYLLGTTYDPTYLWSGCSVEKRGRSVIVKVSYIQDDDGNVIVHNCTPCDRCCTP